MNRTHFDNREKNGDPFPCGASAVSPDKWVGERAHTKELDRVTCQACRRSRAFEVERDAVNERATFSVRDASSGGNNG